VHDARRPILEHDPDGVLHDDLVDRHLSLAP
jgi:hypothetical protein